MLHTNKTDYKSSNTTTKNARSPGGHVPGGDVELEGEEEDSSADDDTSDEEEGEPNGLALSGAQNWNSTEKGERLAGLNAGDMFMNDAFQAVAGAEMDDQESDDDDYAGVEDVSDDEEFVEEPNSKNALRAAEQDLIDEFERTEERRDATNMTADMDTMLLQEINDSPQTRRSSLSSTASLPDAFDLNINMDDDPFLGLASHDSLYQDMFNEAENLIAAQDALASWRQPERDDSEEYVGTKKRVRFMEPQETQETRSRSSSLSSEEEDPSVAFPDLFDPQDDALLRSRFGIDVDLDASFQHDYSDTGSYYDFEGEEERLALEIDDEESDTDDDLSTFDSTCICVLIPRIY